MTIHKALYFKEKEDYKQFKKLLKGWKGFYIGRGKEFTEADLVSEVLKLAGFLFIPDLVATNMFKLPLEELKITQYQAKKIVDRVKLNMPHDIVQYQQLCILAGVDNIQDFNEKNEKILDYFK